MAPAALGAASTRAAAAHFAARLSFETDVSDVHADLEARAPGLVVIDSRNTQAWEQGRLPGAAAYGRSPTGMTSTTPK